MPNPGNNSNHSNTLILTDPRLLHPANASPLQETLNALKEFISQLNIEEKIHSCLQIINFKSFRRIIMIFSNTKIADLVYQYLREFKIKVGFARNDNKLTNCDLDSTCPLLSKKQSIEEVKLNPNNFTIESPIIERYPGLPVFQHKLEPPNPPIQMQSPPPSPYEGWISRPEEPPSDTTLGFHPKALSHILYTTHPSTNDMKRVFSSFIDNEIPDPKTNSQLDDLALSEGIDDENDHKELHGSLFQNPVLPKHEYVSKNLEKPNHLSKLKIPILIIDNQEAENLKKHANVLDNNNNNNNNNNNKQIKSE
jgi:hypothetical protein